VRARRVVVWKDVSGVMSANPKIVRNAFTLRSLSYLEASELSFFGANVLHPRTMLPVWRERIPLEIRNTLQHTRGTCTTIHTHSSPTRAVSRLV
jgi:aspartokinase/homoserine dehydrogenase 1